LYKEETMNFKKIIMYIIIVGLILFILGLGFIIIKNKKEKKYEIFEYIPEKEITEEQLRKTNISLFFWDNNEEKIITEIRSIDSKLLLEKPEDILISNLINGSENKKLKNLIPEGTILIGTEIKNGILFINFSEDFLKSENTSKAIEMIQKTVCQLMEINGIKILINGEEQII